MAVNFFIPKQINVGFQKRKGTYTGKLAYIIYFDEKGKLRKETSWNSWRDKDIDNELHDNEPLSGFVLNKKAGGYATGWNHRQTYVRVYDPRGFEFEITISNLLYILENATSTKGKGLEGDFIYGWDGADLVLIPCEAPDYKELVEYNKKIHDRVKLKGKDMILGATYLNKNNIKLVYLGRFDEWEHWWQKEPTIKRKAYFFYSLDSDRIITIQSLSKDIIDVIDENCADNFTELIDKLERDTLYSPIDRTKDEYIDYSLEEFVNNFSEKTWGINFYNTNHKNISIQTDSEGEYYHRYEVVSPEKQDIPYSWSNLSVRTGYITDHFATLEDVFNVYKPKRRRQYLANGKTYSEGY